MWLGLVIVLLSPISTETDRTADTLIYVNRTLQSYCPNMNFCHRNATEQLEHLDDKQGPCCTPCSCDDECVKFENCCPDKDITHIQKSPINCKDNEVKRSESSRSQSQFQFRVIDKCPIGERNVTLSKKCSGENRTELYDYIWVSNTKSGRIFQNHYCARCHGDDQTEMWNVKTRCKHTFPFSIQSFANMLLNDPYCDIINVMPDHLASVTWNYFCFDYGQSKCEKYSTNQTIVDACVKYVLPLITDGHVYRNIFCFLCLDLEDWSGICNIDVMKILIRTESAFSLLLDFKTFIDDGTDNLQCDTDTILDSRSNQCLKLRCPWGMTAFKGECKMFMLPSSSITVAVNYYLRVQWENTKIDGNNSMADVIQLRNEVLSTFLKNLKYRKYKCVMCIYNFYMMPTNSSIPLADFVFLGKIKTTETCTMYTLFDLLSEVVGKKLNVKFTGVSPMTVILHVSLIPEDEESYYQNYIPGAITVGSEARPCTVGYINMRYVITCSQVEITQSVINSITDDSLKGNLGLLFNKTVRDGQDENAVMYMCIDEYFQMAVGNAVRIDSLQSSSLISVMAILLLFMYHI